MAIYLGDEKNLARKILKFYIGDENGVARKVTKAYIGDVNGVARLFYRYCTTHSFGTPVYDWSYDCESCTATATCTNCGETITEDGRIGMNSYREATCTDAERWDYRAEFETFDSDRCPDWHYGEDALGHNWVDPTCTEDGYCARCGAAGEDALGHNWVDPTCTEDGYCSVCGAAAGIGALGHSWVEPTCTEDGYCSDCGATGDPATGHSWNLFWDADAGSYYNKCVNCGEFAWVD